MQVLCEYPVRRRKLRTARLSVLTGPEYKSPATVLPLKTSSSRVHSRRSDMKLAFLVFTVILLVAVLPRYECRAIENPGAVQAPSGSQSDLQKQSLPILLRLGEEYFFRLGNADGKNPPVFMPPDASSTTVKRALQLQLTQRLLQGKVGNIRRFVSSYADQLDDSMERGKRGEEPPISLDLTFHLLREVLEMARAEQLAQQAHSNRKMMDIFGK
ncbi:hypothetical protein JZ751_007261 [Albula glossodonta]|uniref:Corticotropin-releasing factor domain-containing protein n=1 Tax=Albula glossodonta TaxID=121402 RepID=A0A8T2N3G3_9TELE|nr:hypothetical protein JZ751_007261 [Albula glossodonta]